MLIIIETADICYPSYTNTRCSKHLSTAHTQSSHHDRTLHILCRAAAVKAIVNYRGQLQLSFSSLIRNLAGPG